MKSVYKHSPKGFRFHSKPADSSITVLSSGFVRLLAVEPSEYQLPPYCEAVLEGVEKPKVGPEILINPSKIDSIVFPPAVTYPANKGFNAVSRDWDHRVADTMTTHQGEPNEFTVAATPVAVIEMQNGTKYLVPAAEDGLNKALSVANKILNGTFQPNAKRRKPAAAPVIAP